MCKYCLAIPHWFSLCHFAQPHSLLMVWVSVFKIRCVKLYFLLHNWMNTLWLFKLLHRIIFQQSVNIKISAMLLVNMSIKIIAVLFSAIQRNTLFCDKYFRPSIVQTIIFLHGYSDWKTNSLTTTFEPLITTNFFCSRVRYIISCR